MVKADISQTLSETIPELTKTQASEFLEICLSEIKSSLASGENVLISGFGRFSVRDKNARMGRDPHTGEKLMLTARTVVTFKPSAYLREAVNHAAVKKSPKP